MRSTEKIMKEFKGILAALLTPYDACGNVNHKALKKQVRWLIDQGIDGFYVCGSTGEAFLLSQDERKAILETVATVFQREGISAEGMETADAIVSVPRDRRNDKPLEEQKMKSVRVETFGVEYTVEKKKSFRF